MAVLDVPGTYATIADAVAAASAGDTIAIASSYAGNESAEVSANDLTFDAPATVGGIVLHAAEGVDAITLTGSAPITLLGNAGANTLSGNDGDNVIGGPDAFESGNDTINGGGGNDAIFALTDGTDTLSGGEGDDVFWLRSWGAEGGTLDGGTGTDTVRSGDFDALILGDLVVSNVEILDTTYITATAAQLSSFASIIDSSAEATQIEIHVEGEGGTVDFSGRVTGADSVAVQFGMSERRFTVTGTANADRFESFSHASVTVNAGDGADTIIASLGSSNRLNGEAGDDVIVLDDGAGGTVDGGAGTDIVRSRSLGGCTSTNVEVLENSEGVDATIDQLSSFSSITDGSVAGHSQLYFYLTGYGGKIDFSNRIDNNDSVKIWALNEQAAIDVVGSKNGDSLTGSDYNDRFSGGAGVDTLQGGWGDDVLDGGKGADAMDGGLGDDTYIVDDRHDKASEKNGTGNDTVRSSVSFTLSSGFENLILLGSDKLAGHGSDDFNRLFGNGADNALWGEGADDVLTGGGGADRLMGGTGDDTASYAGSAKGVTASLLDPATNKGDAKGDTFFSIEDLTGTGHADKLEGNAAKNELNGADGDDALRGGGGNDTLEGGTGDDKLRGGDGNDDISGDAGRDSVNGDAGSDFISGNDGDDDLAGGTGDDMLGGDAGDDVLDGGSGKDRLEGGEAGMFSMAATDGTPSSST